MKFLLDVCVSSRSLDRYLVSSGHDVSSVLQVDPRASDETVLNIALRENRILVTEDRDFGELVFLRGRSHGPIIRLVELSVDEQVEAMSELLANHLDALRGEAIVTVSRGRIRIRP